LPNATPHSASLHAGYLLSDALGLQVKIDHRGEGGVVHIAYRDVEQLDEVVRKLEEKH
jgi:ParB family chromosome partitioning protein